MDNTQATPAPAAPVDAAKAAFDAAKTAFGVVSVTRNGVGISFALQQEAKGPTQGEQYLYPDTELTVENLVTLIGADTARRKLNIVFKKGMKQVYTENLKDNNGTFNKDKFIVEAESFPFVSVSMSALKEEALELFNKMSSVDMSTPEGFKEAQTYLAKFQNIKKAIAAKERNTGTPDEDEDDSAPAPATAAS